jgi:hypothetical protein
VYSRAEQGAFGQMKLSVASSLRKRHSTLAGSGSVVDDLLNCTQAVGYIAAHLAELGRQIDVWLAYIVGERDEFAPLVGGRRDALRGWSSLRDRNLRDPILGPDVLYRISALRSRSVYLRLTVGNLRLVTDALAGRPPSGTKVSTLGVPPWGLYGM